MTKSILLFNNKGGIGKSTLTANLSHGLAFMGYKTLILDCDGQKNAQMFLGIEEPQKTLYDLFKGAATLEEIIIKDARENLDYIANGNMREINTILHKQEDPNNFFQDKLKGVKKLGYDIILIDAGPSIETKINECLVDFTDEIAVPIQPEMAAAIGIASVYRFLKDLNIDENKIKYAFVNMMTNTNDAKRNLATIKEFFRTSYPGVTVAEPIKRRVKITEANGQGLTVFEYDQDATQEILKALEGLVINIG